MRKTAADLSHQRCVWREHILIGDVVTRHRVVADLGNGRHRKAGTGARNQKDRQAEIGAIARSARARV